MERTCSAGARLIVGVDSDDERLLDYEALGCELVVREGLRGRLVEWLNVLAASTASEHPYLGHIGDDNEPRSPGWDARIAHSLRANMFCFGDDCDPGRAPGSLSIHIFMRSEVVRRLGYFGPPSLRHMYVDPVWYAWGRATSIEFLPDVVLEHHHYTLGKSPRDASYEASTALIPEDCARYNAYCESDLNRDIEKLGGEPFSPERLAEFNRELNIPKVWD